ncbi:MAG: DUF4301 family protein, partial [Flavobacterium sp.]|nr:DUF4301 family protein [Flavobacterium sp.]
ATFYDQFKNSCSVIKFVPASGAASRMFKFLLEFLSDYNEKKESVENYMQRHNNSNLEQFFASFEKFPFYDAILCATKKSHTNFENCSDGYKKYLCIKTMLQSDDFDFANQPKGTLPFHKFKNYTSTAVDAHLNESLNYATAENKSSVHFTISSEHKYKFENVVVQFQINNICQPEFDVSYSYQSKSTDTLSYDNTYKPIRDSQNNLLFRPGGHGALIENLNQLNADLIFIKNIDNVNCHQNDVIILFKKALSGILIANQQKVFNYIKHLNNASIDTALLNEVSIFLENELFFKLNLDFLKLTIDNKKKYLLTILHRPIRVCGMVQNQGEPGGGPFWVTDNDGNLKLQIIEASQIDDQNQEQLNMLANATHFNPVDLVCGTKNYIGEKFHLPDFVDHNTGFIVEKTKNGIPFKAFELPGLWNGAMANWLTIFVEVPITTFNPVKTVNDLLKPGHQAQ